MFKFSALSPPFLLKEFFPTDNLLKNWTELNPSLASAVFDAKYEWRRSGFDSQN